MGHREGDYQSDPLSTPLADESSLLAEQRRDFLLYRHHALSAEAFCTAIREYWGIENQNHYVRDVTLGEDASRIRVNPHIFAKLRSFALNILRNNQVENVSTEIFDNCMLLERVLNYVGVLEN